MQELLQSITRQILVILLKYAMTFFTEVHTVYLIIFINAQA